MKILTVEKHNRALRKRSKTVKKFNKDLAMRAEKMLNFLKRNSTAAGLASPQIGVHQRMVAIKMPLRKGFRNPMVMIMCNPRIIEQDGEIFTQEACLSIPGVKEVVKRSKHLITSYQDINGEDRELTTDDITSVIIQHELDHLDGILFIDRCEKEEKASNPRGNTPGAIPLGNV